MLDERKYKAIALLAENVHQKTDIAEIVGVSRQTIYDWLKDPEFVAELDSVLQSIKSFGEKSIKSNLAKYIKNVDILANCAESEKIRLEANMYLIDRVLGKTTSKIDVTAESMQINTIDHDIIEQELNQIEELEETEK